jgi:hypothetical protein
MACAPARPASRSAMCWVAEQLLVGGADPQPADPSGRTPLHSATEAQSLPLMRLLLDHGADPRVYDKDGRTALANLQQLLKTTQDRKKVGKTQAARCAPLQNWRQLDSRRPLTLSRVCWPQCW